MFAPTHPPGDCGHLLVMIAFSRPLSDKNFGDRESQEPLFEFGSEKLGVDRAAITLTCSKPTWNDLSSRGSGGLLQISWDYSYHVLLFGESLTRLWKDWVV